MKLDEVWVVKYKDDTLFDNKFSQVNETLRINNIVNSGYAIKLFSDFNIQCGFKQDILAMLDTKREAEFYKIPFYRQEPKKHNKAVKFFIELFLGKQDWGLPVWRKDVTFEVGDNTTPYTGYTRRETYSYRIYFSPSRNAYKLKPPKFPGSKDHDLYYEAQEVLNNFKKI